MSIATEVDRRTCIANPISGRQKADLNEKLNRQKARAENQGETQQCQMM